MIDKIEGIVVGEKSHGETSKIIEIITKEHGVIGVIAKGAKSLKSDFRTTTTKLTYGYFYMNYKEGKLSVLTNVDVITNFLNIQKDITRISYATYMLDLVDQVIRQNSDKRVFDNLIASLNKIDEQFDPVMIASILELKCLDYLGVMPILNGCSICGSKTNLVTLSSDRGGYVCKNCLTNEKIVSEKTMKLIRLFYYVDISKISTLEVSNESKKEIQLFLEQYYDRYTGLYLKSKSLLNQLNKLNV